MAARKCLCSDDEFRQAVAESLSVRQVLSCIGLVPAGGNYKTVHTRIRQLGLDASHFTGAAWNVGERYKAFGRKATLEEILVENSAYAFTHGLRGRLLKEGLKQHLYENCGLSSRAKVTAAKKAVMLRLSKHLYRFVERLLRSGRDASTSAA